MAEIIEVLKDILFYVIEICTAGLLSNGFAVTERISASIWRRALPLRLNLKWAERSCARLSSVRWENLLSWALSSSCVRP